MTRVYLVNMGFGLAGIERRFANIWSVLHRRGHVFPIMAIPSTLATILESAGLLPDIPGALRIVPEPASLAALGRVNLPSALHTPRDLLRSRLSALRYRTVWAEIARDPDAVIHIGMPCSALTPPDRPTVYECVDATFRSFPSRHFQLASTRRCLVHCQTDRIRRTLDAAYAGRRTQWQTITNPTYFAHYAPADQPILRDPRLLAFVGRLHTIKNPLLFLEGVALARQRGCDCRAIMLGEGPLQSEVDAFIAAHGLGAIVDVRFDDQAPASLARAAAYVSLQANDNFGSQALLEAMGAGCAVIASDVGETARIVTDAVGVRVALTPESVADAIVSIVDAPERTRERGAAASALARGTYSADTYAAFLESLYARAPLFHRQQAS